MSFSAVKMNIKILTCLLVVVAYSEAGAIRPIRNDDDFSMGKPVGDSEEATLSRLGREISDKRDTQRQAPLPVPPTPPPPRLMLDVDGQDKIIRGLGGDLVPFIIDCVRHLNARHQGFAPPKKSTHFSSKMMWALEHPLPIHVPSPVLPEKLKSVGTSRQLHILEQTLSEAFIPVIAYIANSMFYPEQSIGFPGIINKGGHIGLHEQDVHFFYSTSDSAWGQDPDDWVIHHNILRFIFRKIIPGIYNVVDKVMFLESLSPITTITSYTLPKDVWIYIYEEVVPVYGEVVKLIEAQNEDANDDDDDGFLTYSKPYPLDDDRRLQDDPVLRYDVHRKMYFF